MASKKSGFFFIIFFNSLEACSYLDESIKVKALLYSLTCLGIESV